MTEFPSPPGAPVLPPLPPTRLRFEVAINSMGERLDYTEADMRAYATKAVEADRATSAPAADLIAAACRVSWKFGHDEAGTPSDWSEWVDLRAAITAAEHQAPVPAPTEVVAWMDDGKKIHNGPGHLVFRVITADTKRNMPASIQAEYTTPLVAQQIQAPAEGDGVRAALERFCDATACIPLPGQPFTTTMFQTLGMALSEARAALDGLPNVQPKGMQAEWQPIATAPRDGSEVLIFEVYERLPVIGWWSEKRKRWHASTEVYDTDGDATVIDKLYTDGVTHWMPLPAPPVMDANDDEVQS